MTGQYFVFVSAQGTSDGMVLLILHTQVHAEVQLSLLEDNRGPSGGVKGLIDCCGGYT